MSANGPKGDMQRRMILAALARGDGQAMSSFDLGQAAEAMYGEQADQVEVLIAAEQRRALKEAAAKIAADAGLMRGMAGDKHRRNEAHRIATQLRACGKALTQEAHDRYASTRSEPDE
jgi:hypothetical protein